MDEGCCFLSPLRHEVRGYFSGPDRTFAPFNFGGVPPACPSGFVRKPDDGVSADAAGEVRIALGGRVLVAGHCLEIAVPAPVHEFRSSRSGLARPGQP